MLTVFAWGCTPQVRTEYAPPLEDVGAVYLYLQPLPKETIPLSFTISKFSVISEEGEVLPLFEQDLPLKGRENYQTQQRLFSATLPPGRYTGAVLDISSARIATMEGDVDLLPPPGPIRLAIDFSILRGRALALFLGLSPEYLVADGIRFTPHFVLEKSHLHPRNYLGFISNTGENLVSVFNKRTMEVVDVISTGVGPKGMALDQERGIIYVALAGDDAIQLINVDTMSIYGRIKLLFGDEPTEIALSGNGETLVSANYGSGTISIIDTGTLSERERLSQEPDPLWVTAVKNGSRAFVLHGLANSISIIDTANRQLQTVFSVDEPPERGTVSRDGDTLYILTPFSSDMQIIDVNSRRITGRIFVGSRTRFILEDPRRELLYIGGRGEVMVVDPAAGMYIDSFPVEGDAGYMTIDGEENMLLTLAVDRDRLYKYNLVNKEQKAWLAAEKGAHAVAVMGEL